MMGFSSREILFSISHAIIYGFSFSLVYQILHIFSLTLESLPALAEEIVGSDRLFPPPSIKEKIKEGKNSSGLTFLSVALFFFGFLLLSYFSLDGHLRIYMLILSSASFYVIKYVFFDVLRSLFIMLFDAFILAVSTVIRLILLPIKRITLSIKLRKKRN